MLFALQKYCIEVVKLGQKRIKINGITSTEFKILFIILRHANIEQLKKIRDKADELIFKYE